MAINLKFDLVGNPEPPTIILANRNGNILGQLKVNTDSIELSDNLNDASEISFTINKYINEELTPLWEQVVDFKLIYCKEWEAWFEIKVELDEETETVKTVFCTWLGQAELSQIMLYNIEINTEKDIERDDYKISILYDANDPEASILNRVLKDKAPHYSIAYVSPTIAKIQRSFSFDDKSILDAFQEIAEEIGCLFRYSAKKDENGILRREVFVYDLQQTCKDCGHRGEYTDVCPKCDSKNIINGYGEDTLIFVTSDELAASGIQLTTDTDSVKNCFKLEAGDDLMTATVRNCNPNGTDYIWYFSDSIKEDMSDELVEKLNSYNKIYKQYYDEHIFDIDADLSTKYNNLIDKYSSYNEELQKISTTIIGYSSLMNAYYNVIDLEMYLKSGLMPSVEMTGTNAEEQLSLLTASSLSPVAVADVTVASLATINSAVLAMAKTIIRPTYKIQIGSSELVDGANSRSWKGNFIITNYSDEEDTATGAPINIAINDDMESFVKQKLDKALNKENADDLSISGLFEKDYDDFCNELTKYAINPLNSFHDACQSCIDIMIDQGVGNKESWSDNDEGSDANLYEKLYLPYYNKLKAIEAETKIREEEISIVSGVYDIDGNLITNGLQTNIEDCKKQVQDALDFKSYLGEKLWLEFCSYRREDKYSNDNYVSDGLNNAELFERALEFFEVAENEIYKSAELQHSISTTLNNLLAIDKFKKLIKDFNVGNWIRVQVDNKIFKLRLIKYDIGYNDFDNIDVEFSDVIKIKNGTTDVKDILSQASSMATSYNSVKRQASQGSDANNTIDQWSSGGLNSSLVQIQNNDNEEITLSKNGLLGRSYDEITDAYSPEQLKITHNIMAYTDDNWETVSAALGKHEYNYYDDDKALQQNVGYGLSAKFVASGYINGSQIIGGKIYSQNYTSTTGTYMDLNSGTFSWAGGKIRYDGNSVNLDGVTIQWNNTNDIPASSVTGLDKAMTDLDESISGLNKSIEDAENNAKNYTDKAKQDAEDYADEKDSALKTDLTNDYEEYANSKVGELDAAVGNYLGLGGSTLIGGTYIISPYIAGGYLNITNTNNNSRVIIDPNNLTGNDYIFQVHNGEMVSVGITKDGNASFAGDITATSLTLEQGVTIGVSNINGLSDVATSGSYNDLTGKPTKLGDFEDDLNVMTAGDVTVSSTTEGNITTTTTTVNGTTYTTYTSKDANYILTNVGMGTESADQSTNYFKVSTNGLLTAHNALIYGTIYSGAGEVGGWSITKNKIYGGDSSTGVCAMQRPMEDTTYVFASGGTNHDDYSDCPFRVAKDGGLYATKATISGDSTFGGTLNAVNGSFTELTAGSSSFSETIVSINANGQGHIVIGDPDYIDSVMGEWIDITIRPAGNEVGNIGTPNHLWDTVYAKTGSISSSDRNMKKDIVCMGEIQEEIFNSLKPVTFKFKENRSGRTHYGFISQDVEDSLTSLGLTGKDFAGFCKDSYINENDEVVTSYSLRYTEFIALNTYMIQKLQEENRKLKERIGLLENKLK